MNVRFVVPPSWHSITTLPDLTCEASSIAIALTWFTSRYPELAQRILNGDNDIASWTLVCLDHVDVRSIGGLQAPIGPGYHEVELLSALMGG